MARLQRWFECVGWAACETAPGALARLVPLHPAYPAFVAAVHARVGAAFAPAEARAALREAVAAPAETVELALRDAVEVPGIPDAFRGPLAAYLESIPDVVRQALRRPGDPDGTSVPEQLPLARPEDWYPLLPDRMTRYRSGDAPEWLEGWRLEQLRGLGPYGEVWRAVHAEMPDEPPVCVKFVTTPRLRGGSPTGPGCSSRYSTSTRCSAWCRSGPCTR